MKKILFIISCLLLSSGVNAQVTIGKTEKPNAGALLDLKNLDTPGANGETANKGMMLPRVTLTDESKLHPMLPNGYNPTENAKHYGMLVYNLGEGADGLCKGVYVWASDKWSRIPESCFKANIDKTELVFYKNAPHAKGINVSSYPTTALRNFTATGNILNWATNQFPASGASLSSYTFQPAVNNTGAPLESVVEIEFDDAGKRKIYKTLTIKQLNRNVTFAKGATGLYPATGGNVQSFPITSEIDWAIESASPSNIISAPAIPSGTIAKTTSNVGFILNNNPTYAERTVTLKAVGVAPYNLDFVPQNIELKQDYIRPVIGRVAPTESVIDYGATGGGPSGFHFTANSSWYFTGDATWGHVVTAINTSQAPNTAHPGGTADQAAAGYIELQISGDYGAEHGTRYSTVLSIVSTGHWPHPTPDVKTYTLWRTARYITNTIGVSPAHGSVFDARQYNVQMSAWTNGPVAATAHLVAGDNNHTQLPGGIWLPRTPASGWSSANGIFSIPANTGRSDRTIYIKRQVNTAPGTFVDVAQHTQRGAPGFYIDHPTFPHFVSFVDGPNNTYANAAAHCTSRGPGWRLPTIAEMSAWAPAKVREMGLPLYPPGTVIKLEDYAYWSSDPVGATHKYMMWNQNALGEINSFNDGISARVRCILPSR